MTSSPDPAPGALLDPGSGLPCPYLRAAGGEWRNAVPSRDHVCGALGTPVPVGPEAQRRLCFGVPEDCERYQAALEDRRTVAPVPPGRPIARTAPVVVERGRSPVGFPRSLNTRLLGQAGLVLVMAAALLALLIARAVGPDGRGAGPTASHGAGSSGGATATASTGLSPSPTAPVSPSASAAASPTPRPSATPSRTPAPSPVAGRTYRVQSGDTLSGIAARFGTTVKVLKQLNGIVDGSLIHVGQVLKLP